MLWTPTTHFHPFPFEKEKDLESAIAETKYDLFGGQRIYLDVKKLIGEKGKTQNIPDGYLLDFSSSIRPVLYLVEVELASHDPLRHIAQQLLNFSLSFMSSPQKMKGILRDTLQKSPEAIALCENYASKNNFSNIDYLLEQMIYREDSFNTLLIIDELDEELENIVRKSLAFPVETLTFQRYRSTAGEVVYQFDPFLNDLNSLEREGKKRPVSSLPPIDPTEIDTIVISAHEEGFRDVFIGENMWRAVRIHSSMLPKIKHIAAYQVAPISGITYVADVERIELWKDTGKYGLYFKSPARKIKEVIPLVPNGAVTAPQGPRYTSLKRLESAKNLDGVF
jgi:hypothetical protein